MQLLKVVVGEVNGIVFQLIGKSPIGKDDEFIVDTGFRKVEVDTDTLAYNPLDDKGFTQIDLGDRVRVSGIVDDEFFDGKEVDASYVTEIL